jgi:hypothetical protein
MWDVAAQERIDLDAAKGRVGELEARLGLAQAILLIEKGAGWKEFTEAIRANHGAAVAKALDVATRDRDYWSGFANGLEAVLLVVESASKSVAAIERSLVPARAVLKAFDANGRRIPQLGEYT